MAQSLLVLAGHLWVQESNLASLPEFLLQSVPGRY
jgi:hypothetical protein